MFKFLKFFFFLFNFLAFSSDNFNLFKRINIFDAVSARKIFITDIAQIGGNLYVGGTIYGNVSGGGDVSGPDSSLNNSVARFSDTTGKTIEDSLVTIDDSGDLTASNLTTGDIKLNSITNSNDETLIWPISTGAAGTFLGSDGSGNLVFSTPAGSGNVDTALNFTTDNAIITVDLPSGSQNIKQSTVLLDSTGNITNVNSLTASVINGDLVGNVTGAASLNVLKAGDTMTGDLQLPAGSNAAPSLKFTGSTSTGLSASSNSLSLNTNAAERMNISSSGTVSIKDTVNGFGSAGVVHNDSSGNLSSSLIVNADISDSAGITDSKLATISTAGKVSNSATTATSANTASAIVARDASGNFSAGTITASLTGAASLNVLKAGDTMTGDLQLPAGSNAAPSLKFTGSTSTGLSASSNSLSLNTNAAERMNISSSGTVSIKDTVNGFGSAGVVHNDSSGNLSSSLIVNADISDSAGITDSKLATISTAGKVLNSATTATSANTASAIVARDASGNFSAGTITASLTGAASLNVLKTGDTMTGDLNMAAQNALKLQDAVGGQYVGINAPSTVGSSYTFSLPSSAPSLGQFLQASSASATQWASVGGDPTTTKSYYVSKDGSDSNDGSFGSPFLTVSKAVDVANSIANDSTPVVIYVGVGIFIEDNSSGPIEITATNIAIVGSSMIGTVISPTTLSNDLFLLSVNGLEFNNMTLDSGGSSTAAAVNINHNLPGTTRLLNVVVYRFQTGFDLVGGSGVPIILFSNVQPRGNGTAISISSMRALLEQCVFLGPFSGSSISNTGVTVTGSSSLVTIFSSSFRLMETALSVTGSSNVRLLASNIESTTNGVVATGSAFIVAVGCNFIINNSSSVNILASGAGTSVHISSSHIRGEDSSGVSQGIGIKIEDSASAEISSTAIEKVVTGIETSGTSATIFNSASVVIKDCDNDISQGGTSFLTFNSGIASGSKISINDPTNVALTFFNIETNSSLHIGKIANVDTVLMHAATQATSEDPSLEYKSSLYSTQGIGYVNPQDTNATLFGISQQDMLVAALTHVRTSSAIIQLMSDTNTNVGTDTSKLRGWFIQKNASSSELAFNYMNNDPSGQSVIPKYTLAQMDGVNNQLQFPDASTKIVFSGDTNLYRASSGVLQTDGDIIVDGLTASRAVATDSNKQLVSSSVTSTELGYLSGVTSSIQTQLGSKVSKSGDTMTGALVLPAGSAASPSLTFTGGTSGLSSAVSNTISFDISGTEKMLLNSSGNLSVANLNTANGIVHNDGSGNLTSSLIVNANITDSTIANGKLATISSSNTPGNIVVRDGSGNFSTNMITILGSVLANTDAATKAYVDSAVASGFVVHDPALAYADSNIASLTGTTTIDGVSLVADDRVLLNAQTDPIENGLWLVQAGAWTRPTDFANGDTAGAAYVLILQGTNYGGTSWVCTTPSAVIDTDPISFAQFSLLGSTTGANVGAGTGLIFRDKTGNDINFKSLIQGSHLVITNNTSDITLATDATSSNTASAIVARDASGNFSAGTITASLTGAASLNVLKAGDTMTGDLQLPAGSNAAPSLKFTGSTSTGLSASSNSLSLNTNAAERMNISSAGTVSIKDTVNGFGSAGVVHNDSSGNLSSSLIVNADISDSAGITDSKLATISTAGKVSNSATTATSSNTASAIVARDASGNFTAGVISATSFNGPASDNVLKAGDTMTGDLQLPAGSNAAPSLKFTGSTSTGLSASSNSLSLNTNAAERMNISSSGTVSIKDTAGGFGSAGVVHNDSSGNLSSSLIVNADISGSAAITDSKLATISTAGKVSNSATTATSANTASAIVARDASGNFTAGTITASLTGAASLNVLKAGDTMTGSLTLPAGSAASPTLQFTGSTNTGISAASANTMSFDSNGVEKLTISTSAVTTSSTASLILGGLLCNRALQVNTVTTGNTVTVGSAISLLLLKSAAAVNITIVFPASPINGQILTLVSGDGNRKNITYDTGTSSIINPLTFLDDNAPGATSGGLSVTYLYYSTDNAWYQIGR